MDRLDEIFAREHIDFIIPCLNSEISNFTSLQPELAKRGVRSVLPTPQSFRRRSKENLYSFCHRLGVAAPLTHADNDLETLARFAAKMGYPVYVKGRFYEAYLVTTPEELRDAYQELVRDWGMPVLVQEIAVGEEYDVVGLGDGEGGLIAPCPPSARCCARAPARVSPAWWTPILASTN